MGAGSDYYAILGVPRGAGQPQIRKAFRERVRACHPDRVAGLDEDLRALAEEKMITLNEAYAVLRDPARRATYDDRHIDVPADRDPSPDRIGEQQFVARAASEEFEQSVKQALSGPVEWTPAAMPETTLALRGARRRTHFYFVLLAAPRLDRRRLRRFLASLDTWSSSLKSRLLGRDRVYAFAAAIELAERERLGTLLDRFNRRQRNDKLREATLLDLVRWRVIPGDVGLPERLDRLLKGSYR